MKEVLDSLEVPDYHFLYGIVQSDINFTNNQALKSRLTAFEETGSEYARTELNDQLEREIRYLGSADAAYLFRYVTGKTPGVPFREIIFDAARALNVSIPGEGSDRELLEQLVQNYTAIRFSQLSAEEQQRLLVDLGVEHDRATTFILKSAGVFAFPALIHAFGKIVVDGLIKNIIFGTITRIVGKQVAAGLFKLLMSRFPWWVRWIGPAAWTASIGWAVMDLQGPALRKTVPVVLYLGVCSLRETKEV